MPRGITALPDEFRKLLELIEQGKLFALQEWIAAGKTLQSEEVVGSRRYLLEEAIRTGFHSVVEVLLRSGGWSAEDLAYCLELARDRSRYDISELPPACSFANSRVPPGKSYTPGRCFLRLRVRQAER